jgi:type I pantothenate kinase
MPASWRATKAIAARHSIRLLSSVALACVSGTDFGRDVVPDVCKLGNLNVRLGSPNAGRGMAGGGDPGYSSAEAHRGTVTARRHDRMKATAASRRVATPGPGSETEFGKPRSSAPYLIFDRNEWAALRASTPLSLSEADLNELRGLTDPVSLADVADVYLPLSRLLNLHVMAARNLNNVVEGAFLGRPSASIPYIIGVAGSVAVGKSTFARLLQAVLARWPDHPRVALVTTDGFLYPTRVLEERNLMRRKGFPESYDLRRMLAFLTAVKAGESALRVPVYSHDVYDVIPDKFQVVDRPDILIFEGLNVLQSVSHAATVASDFFDFSIYLDAEPSIIEAWYVERFLLLQRTAFQKPASFFHRFKDLTEAQAGDLAHGIWRQINLPNLMDNILPTRERAHLVIRKGYPHAIEALWLRRS